MSYRKYAKDYKSQLVSANDGRGMKEIFVYQGPYFTAQFADEKEKNAFRRQALVSSILCCVAFAAGGFVDAGGMQRLWIALPYVVMMIPVVFLTVGAVLIRKTGEKMKREETDHSWRRVRTMSSFLSVLSGYLSLAVLVEVILHISLLNLLLLLICLLIFVLSFGIRRNIQVKCKILQADSDVSAV